MSTSTRNAAACQRRLPIVALSTAFAIALLGLITPAAAAEVTFIHMGDVHGHMVPRPSLYAKTPGATEGGLARMITAINEIRARRTRGKTLLINTGDTIQGSAEALFTRGQALVDVLNRFRIDAYTPGNWDWVYGVERALELFTGDAPKAPWNALAANAYFDGEPYADRAGSRGILAGANVGRATANDRSRKT